MTDEKTTATPGGFTVLGAAGFSASPEGDPAFGEIRATALAQLESPTENPAVNARMALFQVVMLSEACARMSVAILRLQAAKS